MSDCIDAYESTSESTLEGFTKYLRERLSKEMNAEERSGGCLIHVAGYVHDNAGAHPEMWFIRNVEGIDERTGEYVGLGSNFQVTEDFWNRDYSAAATKEAFRTGGYQRYFNGFPPGRIAFLGLSQMLQRFFGQVWAHPVWKFRPPQSLDELASVVELEIRVVGTMFGSSDYPAAYIGGAVQVEKCLPPDDAVVL